MLVDLKNILQNQGFLDIKIRSKILDFKDILENTIEIVRIENNDKPISREQNEYIRKLINKISVVPYFENVGSMSRRTAESDLRMALVADVFTDSAGRKVLEQAVGKPYRFYVPLYDNHGGKRIAVGYTYSYYEFKQPMNNRLNDKQWKKKVYSDDINSLNEYIPNWMTDLILFKNGNSKNKDTVKKSDTTSESKLIIAVKENNVKLVKKLLKDGADINKKNSSGNTALIEASKTGNKSIVMTLLVNGADKKIKNKEGKTAYDIAKENGHSNIIKFLD